MDRVAVESFLSDRIQKSDLRKAILNVLAILEESLQKGLDLGVLCVSATRDAATMAPLPSPEEQVLLVDWQVLKQDKNLLKAMRDFVIDRESVFSVFAVPEGVNDQPILSSGEDEDIRMRMLVVEGEGFERFFVVVVVDDLGRNFVDIGIIKNEMVPVSARTVKFFGKELRGN